ncbi:LOW QUALITY PROTEIN: smoothened homolog [Portunus trituberculatus]|uniref:LOW QUALITY PROTEIN: smoothened homolog n=1 Tax=Portunus trituberculatus TaxID=210409 RepID=UPI001E1CC2DF|nr:LOW QUALITY PROTEIN: smoothened homolog [Portunus trituberculatus]
MESPTVAVLLTLLCSVAVVCGEDEPDAVPTIPHSSSPPPASTPTLPPTTTPVLEENTRIVSLHSSPDDLHLLNAVNQVDQCHKRAECVPLEETTCLGVTLPYTHTSLALSGLPNQRMAREQLEEWSALRNIPRCWAVVQPLLCAVFFPQCNNSSVELPSQEMCVITRGPCRVVEKEKRWPDFLKCHEEYPHKCKNTVRELKFNTTGQCTPPLVATEEDSSWYEGVKGCGVQCANPIFTDEEHKDLHSFVATLGGVCLACSIFTVLTYLIDWRAANKYPVLIIFYINGCFLVASIGFMVQFHPGVRQDLTCRSDGTLREGEPSSGGNISCVVVFVCLYYFMMAGGLWIIILAYSLHTSFKSYAAGLCGDELERRAAYFHLVSWSLPLVLTITIMALAQVEADSVAGICFLSSALPIRIVFLLLPIIIVVTVGGFFLVRGMIKLIHLKMECFNIISDSANNKIVETIIRLAIITVTLTTFTGITVYCHIYQYRNQAHWDKALRDYIMCVTNMTAPAEIRHGSLVCTISDRPSINIYKLHLLAFFGAGIIMSSWCWTPNTIQAWKRFLRRVAGVSNEEPLRLARHRVIAQAFAKRHDFNTAGRLSISLHSMHDDPLGLNFDMNSATSGDISSAWATAIPHLMTRRGALVGPAALALRRNSVDSEYSISRRFSIESGHNNRSSRRHSLDSQMSFHVSDAERLAALHTAARFGRRKRRDWFSLRRGRRVNAWDRRGSNTSDDSNLGSMILPAITMNTQDTLFTNMMKRLNLSSDEPLRSERTTPSAPPAQSLNMNVPLPGQTTLDSEDEVGNENHAFGNDSVVHTVLNNVLKSADIKRKEETYSMSSVTLEKGLPSSIHMHSNGKRDAVDVSVQTSSASIGVQTSLPNGIVHPVMVDKCCQVSTPLLVRASEVVQLNSLGDDNTIPMVNLRVQENIKKTSETSFSNRKRTHNADRPGTPVTKLVSKKMNRGNEKIIGNNRNINLNHGSYKHAGNIKANSSKNKMNRGEANDVMTVLDIADESP